MDEIPKRRFIVIKRKETTKKSNNLIKRIIKRMCKNEADI